MIPLIIVDEANSKKLQKVILQIKSLDDCRQNLDSKAPGGVVDQYICAWAPNKDSCTVRKDNFLRHAIFLTAALLRIH